MQTLPLGKIRSKICEHPTGMYEFQNLLVIWSQTAIPEYLHSTLDATSRHRDEGQPTEARMQRPKRMKHTYKYEPRIRRTPENIKPIRGYTFSKAERVYRVSLVKDVCLRLLATPASSRPLPVPPLSGQIVLCRQVQQCPYLSSAEYRQHTTCPGRFGRHDFAASIRHAEVGAGCLSCHGSQAPHNAE